MDRRHYEPEQIAFGEAFRAFIDKFMAPDFPQWEKDGIVPREIFARAGKDGFLGLQIPAEYGGGGTEDFRFNQILCEQASYAGVASAFLGLSLHNDVCTPYFTSFASEERKQRWLPGIASGELITAVGMTEPGAGSDLAGIRTCAKRDGDYYLVNGAKTFVTNGINADLVILVVRTGEDRHTGLSLLVVERGMAGFERGRNLDKLGLHSQDTAELVLADVRVPVANLLGSEGDGFGQLAQQLAQERLSIAVAAVAESTAAVDETIRYVKDREAFTKTISTFQNTKFVLAELATEVEIAQVYLDECVRRHSAGELGIDDASKVKYWTTELQGRVMDRCVQLHGGYGFMNEYLITRRYADARVSRIYGGTTEIMKTLIAKSLGL